MIRWVGRVRITWVLYVEWDVSRVTLRVETGCCLDVKQTCC